MVNVFGLALLFTYFAIPPQFPQPALFWGIFGGVIVPLWKTRDVPKALPAAT